MRDEEKNTEVTENTEVEEVKESFNLDDYRQRLEEPKQDEALQIKELQDFIKQQDQAISSLRTQIGELKKTNFKLANRSTIDQAQPSLEDIIADTFLRKEKK